eukprot:scaffold666539_cov62-Prasinocladus_malaysianus.AAC.1
MPPTARIEKFLQYYCRITTSLMSRLGNRGAPWPRLELLHVADGACAEDAPDPPMAMGARAP